MTMNERELREMIEFASGYAEKRFAETGEIAPMWHAVTEDGRQLILPMPPVSKNVAAQAIRDVFKEVRAVRCLFIDEAWTAEVSGDEAIAKIRAWLEAHDGSIHDYPDRIEVIIFAAEDRDGRTLTGRRRIVRKINSKPRLGPLEIDDDIKQSEGRFVGMLAPQGSRQ